MSHKPNVNDTTSSVTQVWSITLHFIHHPWDNWLTKRRFLWIFITPGNTSIANQNVANIALLSSAEDSFVLLPLLETRQSAQWGTYTPEQRYRQFLTSTKYIALTLETEGWMNSMLIAISPKPLCRRITKLNKRSWWYSYINLDAIFFYFYMKFLSLWPWPEGHTLYLPTCQI